MLFKSILCACVSRVSDSQLRRNYYVAWERLVSLGVLQHLQSNVGNKQCQNDPSEKI